jgi:hypothetical protein
MERSFGDACGGGTTVGGGFTNPSSILKSCRTPVRPVCAAWSLSGSYYALSIHSDLPPRSGLWGEARTNPDVQVEKFVEGRLVICRDQDLLSMAFARLKRRRAGAAIVFRGTEAPRQRCGRHHHQARRRE